MKISEVLRDAAATLHFPGHPSNGLGFNYCCCWAIADTEGCAHYIHSDAVAYFKSLLIPEPDRVGFYWEGETEETQAQRFMALLFAAECAESEGL